MVQLPKALAAGLFAGVIEVITYLSQCIGSKKVPSAKILLQKALVGFSMGLAANGVRRLCRRMGISYSKVKGGGMGVYTVALSFIKGVAKGHLTRFFSLR